MECYKEAAMSKKKQKNTDKRIRSLRDENRRLRAENYALREEIRAMGGNAVTPARAWQTSLKQRSNKEKLFSKKSYPAFLLASLRSRSFFAYYQRIVYIVKKYTFITTSVKIFTFLFTVIQSSALFVLFTGTLAVTVPITAILSYVALTFTFLFRKRITARTRRLIEGKNVAVLFPSKGRAFEKSSYFRKMLDELASKDDTVVVIVSPYYFSPKGFSKSRKYYLATRAESDNVIMMRNHYFFTFKKKILAEIPDKTTFIF